MNRISEMLLSLEKSVEEMEPSNECHCGMKTAEASFMQELREMGWRSGDAVMLIPRSCDSVEQGVPFDP